MESWITSLQEFCEWIIIIYFQLLSRIPDFRRALEVKREHMNYRDEPVFAGEVRALGNERLLLARLWTETTITFAALGINTLTAAIGRNPL